MNRASGAKTLGCLRRFSLSLLAWAVSPSCAGKRAGPQCPAERSTEDLANCVGPRQFSALLDAREGSDGQGLSVRPPCTNGTHSGPTVVEVQFVVTLMSYVDVKVGQVGIHGYLRSIWHDPRLAFNSTSEGGCVDTMYHSYAGQAPVWVPDLYITNLAGGDDITVKYPNSLLQIEASGSVTHTRHLILSFICKINLQELPWDRHTCGLHVSSYSQSSEDMRLIPRGGVLAYGSSGVGLKARDLTGSVWKPTADFVAAGSQTPGLAQRLGDSDDVFLFWEFERQPGFYENNFIIPAHCFLMLSYMQLFVDRASTPARATLAALPIYIMITLFQAYLKTVPEGGQRVGLSRYLMCMVLMCVCSALEFATLQVYLIKEQARRDNLAALQAKADVAKQLVRAANEAGVTLSELMTLGHNAPPIGEEEEEEEAKRALGGAPETPCDEHAPAAAQGPSSASDNSSGDEAAPSGEEVVEAEASDLLFPPVLGRSPQDVDSGLGEEGAAREGPDGRQPQAAAEVHASRASEDHTSRERRSAAAAVAWDFAVPHARRGPAAGLIRVPASTGDSDNRLNFCTPRPGEESAGGEEPDEAQPQASAAGSSHGGSDALRAGGAPEGAPEGNPSEEPNDSPRSGLGETSQRVAAVLQASTNGIVGAVSHSRGEGNLVPIEYARNVFEAYQDAHARAHGRLEVTGFRWALCHFNIYVSRSQAAQIMCMFLRDSGRTTASKSDAGEGLTLGEFTMLLLDIDDYSFWPGRASPSWWMVDLATSPPSTCIDVIGRCLYFIAVLLIDFVFLFHML